MGCERELGVFDTATQGWEPFCRGIDGDVENTIINDGLVFEDNLIFGTKHLEFSKQIAGLYLWRGRDKQLIRFLAMTRFAVTAKPPTHTAMVPCGYWTSTHRHVKSSAIH